MSHCVTPVWKCPACAEGYIPLALADVDGGEIPGTVLVSIHCGSCGAKFVAMVPQHDFVNVEALVYPDEVADSHGCEDEGWLLRTGPDKAQAPQDAEWDTPAPGKTQASPALNEYGDLVGKAEKCQGALLIGGVIGMIVLRICAAMLGGAP